MICATTASASSRSAFDNAVQLTMAGRTPQLLQGVRLELAYPLATELQGSADLFQRLPPARFQPEAGPYNIGLARRECLHTAPHALAQLRLDGCVQQVVVGMLGEQVSQLPPALGHGRVEGEDRCAA